MDPNWTPQPNLLQQVLDLLQAYLVPNNTIQRESYERLQQFQQNIQFNLYLVHILSNTNCQFEPNIRQLAGLLLKRNIKSRNVAMYSGKSSMELEMLAQIRNAILCVLADDKNDIRNTASSIVTTFVSQYTFMDEWPELMPVLFQYLEQQENTHAIAGAFSALSKICEDSASKLESSPSRPLNLLIPILLRYFQHVNPLFRRESLHCINYILIFMPVGLVMHMEAFLQGISQLTTDSDNEVRKLVCKSIVILLEVGVQYLAPHLDQIIQFILRANQDEDAEIAIEACEFWASFVELREFKDLRNILEPYLQQIIPLLFEKMVYSEEDLAIFEAEEAQQHENVPDRLEEIKPVFHKSHKSRVVQDQENEEEEDDEDDDSMLQWNLRRCSAASLDNLANGYGNAVLPVLLPLLQERLSLKEPWPLVESGILALGAIADGCYTGITPHLSQLFPFLLQKLNDPAPFIRSITCWTLSRYAVWIVDQGNHEQYLKPLIEHMLARIVDPHKKVQEAACSAFCTLEEEAREDLLPYLGIILQTFSFAFCKYQAKNLLILYDAIGTLADSVSSHLNEPEYIALLMPPLIAKWNEIGDSDRELLPLFECLASVASALGLGFQDLAVTVYTRCRRIIDKELLADAVYDQDPTQEAGDTEFIVCALDLISGLVEGLGQSSEALFHNTNILNALVACLKHENLDVRQSVMGVIGDLAKYAPLVLKDAYKELIPLLMQNIDAEIPTICNNASWAIGEIAIRMEQEFQAFVPECVALLTAVMNRAKIERNLMENCAITLGRLAFVCPEIAAPFLSDFCKPLLRSIGCIGSAEEKEQCLLGLCYMVRLNPNALVADFMYFCGAIASLEHVTSEELKQLLYQLLHSFKQSMGEHWQSYFASFPANLQAALSQNFSM